MSVLAEFSIVPVGQGESIGEYVARCVREVEASGLPHSVHAMGTEIEGRSFREVSEVIERCLAAVASDCDRVELDIKMDFRRGRENQLDDKVASVRRRVGKSA